MTAVDAERRGQWQAAGKVLTQRDFRLFFTARAISSAGTTFALTGLPFAVLAIGGTARDLSYVLVARTVPMLGFFLISGTVSDRTDRRLVMILSDLGSFLCQATAGTALISRHASVAALAILAGCKGVTDAFRMPAMRGAVVDIVPAERLRSANALLSLANNGSSVLGVSLAGLTVAVAGPGWALNLDGISFLISAVLLARIGARLPRRNRRADPGIGVREVWERLRSVRWLWSSIACMSLLNIAWTSGFTMLGPVVTKLYLGGAVSWGFTLSAMSAGLIVGGMAGLRIRPRHALLAASCATLLCAVPLVALAMHRSSAMVAISGFAAGAAIEYYGVQWYTAMQENIPEHMLSRISALDSLGSAAGVPLGYACMGAVATAVGAPEAAWIDAAVIAASVSLLVFLGGLHRVVLKS